MNRLRSRVTYANVTSTLALFVALGMGSAYAASHLADKSVGARQLRPGAVTADKIRKSAVTAPKIEALAVKQGKIAGGAVTAAKIENGAIGAEKIAAGAVTPDKIPNDSLTGAKIDEASLTQVPSAATASFASVAETANPEAFAKVDGEGTVLPGNSKGIGTSDVNQSAEAGIYCINIPGFTPRGAQVTAEFTGNGAVNPFVKLGVTPACPSTEIEVQMRAPGLIKAPFFIVVYR
jgi:hypothetical protein